jgi:hypothetical protein
LVFVPLFRRRIGEEKTTGYNSNRIGAVTNGHAVVKELVGKQVEKGLIS